MLHSRCNIWLRTAYPGKMALVIVAVLFVPLSTTSICCNVTFGATVFFSNRFETKRKQIEKKLKFVEFVFFYY